jgi:hypothetical protein
MVLRRRILHVDGRTAGLKCPAAFTSPRFYVRGTERWRISLGGWRISSPEIQVGYYRAPLAISVESHVLGENHVAYALGTDAYWA